MKGAPSSDACDEPPTAVACGASDGTPIVFGPPSRHVLPVSPDALNTLTPEAAAVASTASMPCTSAAVVWSSQYVQLLLMIVMPSSTIRLNIDWKLPPPLNGAS